MSSTSRFIALSMLLLSSVSGVQKEPKCRDKISLVSEYTYRIRTCSMCFHFLFPKKPLALGPAYDTLVPRDNTTSIEAPVKPDVMNSTSMQVVCEVLNPLECNRWTDCCKAAEQCCQEQQSSFPVDKDSCPRNWDGFSCWEDTPPGVKAYNRCPSYMLHSITSKRAIKECTINGTWFKNEHNFEWTDYRPCVDKESHITRIYVAVICCVISICFLLPSIVIFLAIRELLKQHRVKLHINFFASLLLGCVVTILWMMLVEHNKLVELDQSKIALFNNPVWCRTLSVLKIYLTSTNYFWMFCEGYYLHRLLSNAFEPPKNLLVLYLIGWACPAICVIIYFIAYGVMKNEGCWMYSLGAWQWIIYTPNLLCLLLNLIFLANILRILMFQLHAHPHEPSNFRRGLKAALMLVPLFGIQMFLTIYRPHPKAPVIQYEYATAIVINSQGVFVSLIFCFFNGELLSVLHSRYVKHCQRRRCTAVPQRQNIPTSNNKATRQVLNHMRNTCPCIRWLLRRRSSMAPPMTSMTQVSTYEDRRSPTMSARQPHEEENDVIKVNDSNGDVIEMEEFNNTNGSITKSSSYSPTKKGDYVAVPT